MSTSFKDFNEGLIKDLRAHGGKATSGPFVGRDDQKKTARKIPVVILEPIK